jgi:hypothetical protein
MSPFTDAILHALKYSGQDVFGLFITKSDIPEVYIPLFHSTCLSVPLLRTALSIVESMEGYKIIGVFYASGNHTVVPPVAKVLHEQISETHKTNVLLFKFEVSQLVISGTGVATSEFIKRVTIDGVDIGMVGSDIALDIDTVKRAIHEHSLPSIIYDFEDFLAEPEVEWLRL